jgi:hypothetical protein
MTGKECSLDSELAEQSDDFHIPELAIWASLEISRESRVKKAKENQTR